MHLGQSFATLCLLSFASSAAVIDFETLPSTYMFLGDAQNIGSYYAGVSFGPNVTGLDLTGVTAYPPHSGSIGVWDPYDNTVTISFANPQTTIGLWYTSFELLIIAGYDSNNTLLASAVGSANTDGSTGSSDFLSITALGISSVTLAGSPGNYVFDDLTASGEANPVPEASSRLLLIVGLLFVFRTKI
ncbi:MAG TPA: hypothetical protein VN736_10770 [Candidatus Limnocylindrales bacterium]|nr:hypothetical protein [Candidatus Limnocylindrales bacterium]